ncbi:MAG: asparagine synthase-related protein [Undibacterium sp.]|uniref:asparagine synthase-related protein n=1 Tax=Undibacterium sp. TaxID=1914977 RepID=UPI002723AA3B|nr:asparagine synthase-related protein [Undibacterium sp.]MDO8653370.1 asparagine synthase-related protein [Undibacterium sp.]
MRDGLYGLFKLDQEFLNNEERFWLEMENSGSGDNQWQNETAGFIFVDSTPLKGDTGYVVDAEYVTGFMGDLDNREVLANLLDLPFATSAGQLVWAAIRHFGESGLNLIEGQWTFWVWDAIKYQLTVAVSRNLRDALYLVSVDGCVALSSSIRHLQALPWLPKGFDDLGLLLLLGRAPLRSKLDGRTWQREVISLLPGSIHSIRLGAHTQSIWAKPLQAEEWHGNFDDAVNEMEMRARRAVRNRIRRHKTIAVLLSGGMDSSLLAWLAATELRPDQRLIAISSVASKHSGIQDERRWIEMVAKTLGIEVYYVSPDSDKSVYFPSSQHFDTAESPIHSPRHYLYEKLFAAAYAAGADAILDGCFGEQSLTRSCVNNSVLQNWRRKISHFLQQSKRAFRRWIVADISDLFHIRLSREKRMILPAGMTKKLPANGLSGPSSHRQQAIGFPQGYAKAALNTEMTSINGLRRLLPFRAPELVSLSAALPGKFFDRNGQSRVIVRSILSKHFPPELSMRTDKKPFCPEHLDLLKRNAAVELLKIELYGSLLAWEWIDKEWLCKALQKISLDQADVQTRDVAQATCTALAFLRWQESLRVITKTL